MSGNHRDHLYRERIAGFEEGTCVECGGSVPKGKKHRFAQYVCSEECSNALHDLLMVHIRARIVRECDWKCAQCGAETHVVHHIKPLQAGGTSEDSNLVPLCVPCHAAAHDALREQGSLTTLLGMTETCPVDEDDEGSDSSCPEE